MTPAFSCRLRICLLPPFLFFFQSFSELLCLCVFFPARFVASCAATTAHLPAFCLRQYGLFRPAICAKYAGRSRSRAGRGLRCAYPGCDVARLLRACGWRHVVARLIKLFTIHYSLLTIPVGCTHSSPLMISPNSTGTGDSKCIIFCVTGCRNRMVSACKAKRPIQSSVAPYFKSPTTGCPVDCKCTRI